MGEGNAAIKDRPSGKTISVKGVACRLPGAPDYNALNDLLMSGICAVSEVPSGRFSKGRWRHPKPGHPGKSYTFRAGVLEDYFDFDPAPFGISPREAALMDPQQRLLLQVVWEAIEDAGIPHTALAGEKVGVYVGASGTDYRDFMVFDPGSVDPYLMTGNTLSLVSNRISYIFDLQGPSFTVDTACSSSLVALENAFKALDRGEIDTAIVAGVNALLSPFPFGGFSAAGMLSPEGLCRAFDADGKGYVRAEGGVAVVLQRDDLAPAKIAMPRSRAEIVSAGINSDGKTVGVSLPSHKTQGELLKTLYDGAGIDLNDLAFFEAHGTGTRVGDPAETQAIGDAVAKQRDEPLLIGSIKTNIGHLEPASGLAGLLKAIIAFEQDTLPASLHFETPNPDIDFDGLNIKVAKEKTPLKPSDKPRFAGVSTFGFGGTNAHVILREATDSQKPENDKGNDNAGGLINISAHGEKTLRKLAGDYAALLEENPSLSINALNTAIRKQRASLPDKAVINAANRDAAIDILRAFEESDTPFLYKQDATLATGRSDKTKSAVAFVFTGNGAQFVGMGREEYDHNSIFRGHFDAISTLAEPVFGWSASKMLQSEELTEKLDSTAIAQPLLYVLQMAIVRTLGDYGLMPHANFGHSVGEVAAATTAGALTLEQGIKVIHTRSQQQEKTRGKGKMAAAGCAREEAEKILADIRSEGHTATIAAFNGPTAVTVSGDVEGIEKFARRAKAIQRPAKVLDLDYGFHCSLMDPTESGLKSDLADLKPGATNHIFVSSVSGKVEQGQDLTADYWWRNIREPVNFMGAAEEAFELGCRVFVEIGPRSLFKANLRETFSDKADNATLLDTLKQGTKRSSLLSGERADLGRHLKTTALSAFASGASVDREEANDEAPFVNLPTYPWDNKPHLVETTSESFNAWRARSAHHMLLGVSQHADANYWRSTFDAHSLPMLADHKVDGKVILPGAAYVEMALSAAALHFGTDRVEIRDMDIVAAIEISDSEMTETHTEISEDAGSLSISSRKRLTEEEWTRNASARIAKIPSVEQEAMVDPAITGGEIVMDEASLYSLARTYGLDYGPSFARAKAIVVHEEDGIIEVVFRPHPDDNHLAADSEPFMLDPSDLDIAFHGLVALYDNEADQEIKRGFIPVRFGKLQIFQPHTPVSRAFITVNRASSRSISANFSLYGEDGALIAQLEDGRFRAASLVQRQKRASYTYHMTTRSHPHDRNGKIDAPSHATLEEENFLNGEWHHANGWLLLSAAAHRISYDIATELANEDRHVVLESLMEEGRLNPEDATRLSALMTVLENEGIATVTPDANGWALDAESDLPEVDVILKTVLETLPEWTPYTVMLSHIWHHSKENGAAGLESLSLFDNATLDHARTATPLATDTIETALDLVKKAIAALPANQPYRILEIANASGGLTRRLVDLMDDKRGTLISVGSDKRIRGIFALSTTDYANVEMLDRAELPGLIGQSKPFDIIVSAQGLSFEDDLDALLRQANQLTHSGSRLILCEMKPSNLHDVLYAYEDIWFARSQSPEHPLSAERSLEEWKHLLDATGFTQARLEEADDGTLPALIIQANPIARENLGGNLVSLTQVPNDEEEKGPKIILATAEMSKLAEDLLASFDGHGTISLIEEDARVLPFRSIADLLGEKPAQAVDIIDLTAGMLSPLDAEQGRLSAHIARTNDLVRRFAGEVNTFWAYAPGGARALSGDGASYPVQTGLWSYLRTIRNEYDTLAVKTFDIEEGLDRGRTTGILFDALGQDAVWSEAILTDAGIEELVATVGYPTSSDQTDVAATKDMKTTLAFEDMMGVDDLKWKLLDRQTPDAGEVEVEIAATGLNFRDVMWALGVLPDEALEDGFAGATLGFECAGRVVSVGEGVTKVKVGDPVIALGPACFSSHLTVDAISVAKLPDDVDLTAAATMPVTFLTAYYALHHLARVEEDEWVLIHGGAGGVGLAAIQIAQWQGAKIIATAGSDEKRNLLRTLGVDHVLDSRSLEFVDEVMAITEGGVDVVLNSLFGEAMERGIELLKPFGRFLELGKRDYYGNTKIGLRPFRRNITYFGIDADQLLSQKPKLAERLFAELMNHVEDEVFHPLPYRKFSGDQIVDAFRLMQKSGHIGKIVVTPQSADELTLPSEKETLTLTDDGHYVVVGGLGGFGAKVCDWLKAHGANKITVTSRSGTVSEEQAAHFDMLRSNDVDVTPVACDASDKQALAALLDDLRQTAPIKGVVHAAMVLRDGLIDTMSDADIDDVLTPKVMGATNLDDLTHDDPLDIFVLFSSITTFIGNPGQASYVAANGYLEGLARKRRSLGKPALAVGWGAITDAGYLARNEAVSEAIAKRAGTTKFTAEQALSALTHLMETDDGSIDRAVISVAPMDWSTAKNGLKILDTSTFTILKRRAAQTTKGSNEAIDVMSMIEGKSNQEARSIISAILVKEVSAVLRTPAEDINTKRPLTDLGMDSLMGVELRAAAQNKLSLDIPLTSIANGISVDDIARKMLEKLRGEDQDGANASDTAESEVASYHIDAEEYREDIDKFKKSQNKSDS